MLKLIFFITVKFKFVKEDYDEVWINTKILAAETKINSMRNYRNVGF